MILEWFEYMKTSCPKHLRAMGYLRELIGIQSRFKRRKEAWNPHLTNCKKSILKAALQCDKHDRILIIGTGLWYDIPVDELCATFKEVVFADILHLPKIVKKARRYKNLSLIAMDATGITEKLYQAVKTHDDPFEIQPIPIWDKDYDLVVSLNLWSQLPVLQWEFLASRTKMSEEELDWFCEKVIVDHLAFLKSFPGQVCLIADYHREAYENGKVTEIRDTLRGVPFPPHDDQWVWDIAPKPEQDPHADIRLQVKACYNLDK
ncbi:MAG: hypothetical protein OQJ97_16205 [Rhodospirillales bacterium]|nr:hypothetical protein [Rhodospirillales bacterium]